MCLVTHVQVSASGGSRGGTMGSMEPPFGFLNYIHKQNNNVPMYNDALQERVCCTRPSMFNPPIAQIWNRTPLLKILDPSLQVDSPSGLNPAKRECYAHASSTRQNGRSYSSGVGSQIKVIRVTKTTISHSHACRCNTITS